MDTFCLIFKSIGDYILPIIGLLFAAGTVFPTLGKWFKKKETALKASPWKRLFFGISLAVFCVVLIAASIRIQMAESSKQENELKEQLSQSSLVYQQQMALKHETEALAKHLSKIAIDFDTNQQNRADFPVDELLWLKDVTEHLSKQGLSVDNAVDIYNKAQQSGDIKGETLKKIADELTKLADQLPTAQ